MYNARERGFSLIELVVAIAFVGVVIAGIMELFTALRQANKTADSYTIALQVAQELVEKYRNTPYNSITVGTQDVTTTALGPYSALKSPRSAQIIVTQEDPDGIKRLAVQISYKDRTGTRRVQLETLISNRGINK
jgi:prepilin-type N-terminal cleavage/methylation domain-containing protein